MAGQIKTAFDELFTISEPKQRLAKLGKLVMRCSHAARWFSFGADKKQLLIQLYSLFSLSQNLEKQKMITELFAHFSLLDKDEQRSTLKVFTESNFINESMLAGLKGNVSSLDAVVAQTLNSHLYNNISRYLPQRNDLKLSSIVVLIAPHGRLAEKLLFPGWFTRLFRHHPYQYLSYQESLELLRKNPTLVHRFQSPKWYQRDFRKIYKKMWGEIAYNTFIQKLDELQRIQERAFTPVLLSASHSGATSRSFTPLPDTIGDENRLTTPRQSNLNNQSTTFTPLVLPPPSVIQDREEEQIFSPLSENRKPLARKLFIDSDDEERTHTQPPSP